MKNLSKTMLAVLAAGAISCVLFSEQAQAVTITGGVSMSGGYTTNTGNLNTATAFTSFTGVFLSSVSGSYTPVPVGGGSPVVTMIPFSFNPFPGGGVIPLWSFAYLGVTYSFDLTALTSMMQPGDDTLTLKGHGILHISGFQDTVGSWLFTANQAGGTFSFSSSNAAVPDGGTTVALLGLGLAGVGVLRRKLRRT
jgi:hypothetical protein